ncbi:beta-ketoacyl-[acyl-carrier-protein] synthase family protein [Stigmatella erecta]|uniref:3-oxoacyl-[acyl-carrier-protein] synthase II n=1 Tax=Stigmatella erecta TaxID=83460 RepID=A0A1I0KLV8_9BACT|nr:beta-ketoacyl-[acyl-carrier-protein] synthase family protein [Stigmatella erecta]SEU26003.1 3-oxoacyl-[acyl-carrier-protein] synthase II [Stigmatella erecta]
MSKRNVVVTGVSVITSVGVGVDAFWSAVCRGEVGTGKLTRFSPEGLRSDRAGEIKNFDDTKAFRHLDPTPHQRGTRLAMSASRMAVEDAKLSAGSLEGVSERAGVVMGVVVANRPGLEAPYGQGHKQPEGRKPVSLRAHDVALVSEVPASELGLRGPSLVIPTACAAGNSAIGCAMDLIQDGHADLMLAGGVDELSPAMLMMFSLFDAMSTDVVRPFDKNRRGLILSEGAAVLVLEAEEHARARGAHIYGRVLGHGNFADAHDMTHPHPEGLGARLAMESALRESGLSPKDVHYVSAHGTGTPTNDPTEARAIRDLFGSHTDSLPVSSIKSMLGHSQGAASAIESVACLMAMRDGVVPPTVNFTEADPECQALDVVPNQARKHRVQVAMNNAFGFGGNISCVVFGQ